MSELFSGLLIGGSSVLAMDAYTAGSWGWFCLYVALDVCFSIREVRLAKKPKAPAARWRYRGRGRFVSNLSHGARPV